MVRSTRLGDIARLSKGVSYKGSFLDTPGPRLLGLGTIIPGGGLQMEKARTYGGPLKDRQMLRPGEMFIALTDITQDGRVLGSPAMLPDDADGAFAITHHVARISPVDGNTVDKYYLYYALQSPAYREYMRGVATGTTVRAVSVRDASEYPLALPTLKTQTEIGSTLFSLDEKLALNKRLAVSIDVAMQHLLASVQRAHGRSRGSTPQDVIPPVATLGSLCELHRATIDPRAAPHETFELYSIPAFDAGRAPETCPGSSISSQKILLPEGAVLVSKLNPRIPRVWVPGTTAGRRSICSTEFLVLLPRHGRSDLPYMVALLGTGRVQASMAARATGTSGSHQRIKANDFLSIELPIAPRSARAQFAELASPLLELQRVLIDQSRKLASCRDALVPRLIAS